MIGKLKGKIDSIYDEYLILDVNGVGYRIFCSSKILNNYNVDDNISLIINTIVREDAILLFGFTNDNEKSWFDNLCKINGIGSKMALKIMGVMTAEDIIKSIDSEDSKSFCRIPGIGQKIASRIVVELKNIRNNLEGDSNINVTTTKTIDDTDNRLKDALSALENLGYQRSTSYGIIVAILKEKNDIVLESLITETLKKINKF
jgi:Holliday junction DNA helicase RuvA